MEKVAAPAFSWGQSAVVEETDKKQRQRLFRRGEVYKSRSTLKCSGSSSHCGKPLPEQVDQSVSVSPGRMPKWLKCYMWLMDTVLLLGAGGK